MLVECLTLKRLFSFYAKSEIWSNHFYAVGVRIFVCTRSNRTSLDTFPLG